jgi:hypothetical protein
VGGRLDHSGDGATSLNRTITQYGVTLGYTDALGDGTRFDLNVQPAPNVRLTLDGTGYFGSGPVGAQASAALAVDF